MVRDHGVRDVDHESAGVLVGQAGVDFAIRAGQGSQAGDVADSGSAVTDRAVASNPGR